MKSILWVLMVVWGLTGCAAMNESECRVGDWYGAGLRDGQQGSSSRIGDYAESCGKIGIQPILAQYNRGLEQGWLSYCTPDNGYRLGRSGRSMSNVCAPELQQAFLREYERGYQRYRYELDISNLESKMASGRHERHQLEDRLAKADNEEQGRRLLRQLNQLNREQMTWQRELIHLQMLQPDWQN